MPHKSAGNREKFIIQSHICSVWKNGQYCRTRNLDEVKRGFEEMMSLLKTDFIDVGMIHYCDAMSDWEAIVENGILDYARELKAQGRIRHIGLSSHNPLVAERAAPSVLQSARICRRQFGCLGIEKNLKEEGNWCGAESKQTEMDCPSCSAGNPCFEFFSVCGELLSR